MQIDEDEIGYQIRYQGCALTIQYLPGHGFMCHAAATL
jgi:hypothetical protein